MYRKMGKPAARVSVCHRGSPSVPYHPLPVRTAFTVGGVTRHVSHIYVSLSLIAVKTHFFEPHHSQPQDSYDEVDQEPDWLFDVAVCGAV